MCVVGYTSYASSVHICMSTLWLASGFDPCAIYWLIKYLDIYIYIDKVPGCWECAPLVSPFPPLHFRHPVAATPGSIGDDNDEDVDDVAIRTRDTGFLGSATIVNCILIWWTCGNIANQLYLQEIMVMLNPECDIPVPGIPGTQHFSFFTRKRLATGIGTDFCYQNLGI